MPLLRKVPIISLAVFCGLGNSACTPDYGKLITSPADLPPSIFAFLSTAADSQYVIIQNAEPVPEEAEKFLEAEYQRLRQARVSLQGKQENFIIHRQYERRRSTLYGFAPELVFVSAHRVRPGESYQLRIEIPEKGIYSASTTAPGDFQILAPAPADTIDVFKPMSLRWSPAAGAAGYRLVLRSTFIDSTRFKRGTSNEVEKSLAIRAWYFPASPDPFASVAHGLDFFYKLPGDLDFTLIETVLALDAFDAPAWLAHEINQRDASYEFEKEIRLAPGVYSNIAGGRGLMTAITTKTIPLLLPPQEK